MAAGAWVGATMQDEPEAAFGVDTDTDSDVGVGAF
jgi:hypothetical protein